MDERLDKELMEKPFHCPKGHVMRQREWGDPSICTGYCKDCEIERRETPLHKEEPK